MKRIFDLIFSTFGALTLFPLFILVGVFIKLDDGGSVFFKQKRVGRNGKEFRIWKFRTMKENNSGPAITVSGDQRVTDLGKTLRKYKIDELPQLINVMLGEMSFVGPRPEVEKYVSLYSPEQKKVLSFRPGITDPASLKYRNENDLLAQQDDPEDYYINEIMKDKVRINIEYAESSTLISDFKVIMKTIFPSSSRENG